MRYPVIPKPPVTVDGTETLNIEIDWRGGHRDKVRVTHTAVRAPAQHGEVELLIDGRSTNDLLRAIAQFMDWALELPDDLQQAIIYFRS